MPTAVDLLVYGAVVLVGLAIIWLAFPVVLFVSIFVIGIVGKTLQLILELLESSGLEMPTILMIVGVIALIIGLFLAY